MKKTIFQLILLILQTSLLVLNSQTMNIRINQIGYYPDADKIAIVVWSQATNFEVVRTSDSTVVFTGALSESKYSRLAEDSIKWADFSELKTPGKYFIRVTGFGNSLSFEISKSALKEIAHASLKGYYYQRCSYKLEPEYAGMWARNAGHPDNACIYDYSTNYTGTRSCIGGWYDAGDYGKYVIVAGITVGTLLQTYEFFPKYFSDSSLTIPESGNGKNDLLDEVKIELDWLKTMQDNDGGVFNKITTEYFPDNVMPANDLLPRYVYGKLTGTTLDYAAMMAIAGRLYTGYDSVYAKDCIERAEKAWLWAKDNPNITEQTGGTGIYPDDIVSDEFYWAAAELLVTTGKDEYKNYIEQDTEIKYYTRPSWKSVEGMAYYSLAQHQTSLNSELTNKIKNALILKADTICNEIQNDAYRNTTPNFTWGTNAHHGNYGVILINAYMLTKDLKYIKAASEITNYYLGQNATAFSFLTGYGHKSPMNILQRISISDGIVPPVPGLSVGGTIDLIYYTSDENLFIPPLKCYADNLLNPMTNEIAINWNAPVVMLFSAVDCILGDSTQKFRLSPKTAINNAPVMELTPGDSSLISLPWGGTYKKNQKIDIKASITSSSKIKSIELYVDGKLVDNTKNEFPYEYSVGPFSSGNHIISVNAIDTGELVTEKNFQIHIENSEVEVKCSQIKNISLSVIPNPTTGLLTLSFGTTVVQEALVEIYNLQGNPVFSETYYNTATATIDLSGFSTGIYLVKVMADENSYEEKLILK